MHELGHNLGLRHGGNDDILHKPNYLSVMNYSFQFRGLHINGDDGFFDYSVPIFVSTALDENNLYEELGLSGIGFPEDYGTRKFNCNQNNPQYTVVEDVNDSIDWNCNGTIEEDPVQANVNGDSGGTNFIDGEILIPFNDWENIDFNGGLIGLGDAADPLPIETEANEMRPEDLEQIPADEYILALPLVINQEP
jgi:hypothetical protein